MSASRVGIDGGSALVNALGKGSALQALDLTGNPMAPELAKPLEPLLQQSRKLTCLILSDLNLGPDGSAAVAQVLADASVAPQLRVLDLSQNEISPEATPSLAKAVAARAGTLQTLVLSDNEMECAGAIHIATALERATALKQLDLRTNMIGRVGAQEVARVLCGSNSTALCRVELDDNQIAAEGIEAVRAASAASYVCTSSCRALVVVSGMCSLSQSHVFAASLHREQACTARTCPLDNMLQDWALCTCRSRRYLMQHTQIRLFWAAWRRMMKMVTPMMRMCLRLPGPSWTAWRQLRMRLT